MRAVIASVTSPTAITRAARIRRRQHDGQSGEGAATNTAAITSLAGFVNSQKTLSKSVGAFDSLDRSAAENDASGNDESDALHFDAVLTDLLAQNQATYAQYSDWDAAYVDAYATDSRCHCAGPPNSRPTREMKTSPTSAPTSELKNKSRKTAQAGRPQKRFQTRTA